MKGAQVTTDVNIPYARDTDFVLNTKFLSGMKISEVKVFIPSQDATTTNTSNHYEILYPHNLSYVPATICFQGGIPGSGWQNDATIVRPSISADNRYVYVTCDYFLPSTPIYAFIFQEKIADA